MTEEPNAQPEPESFEVFEAKSKAPDAQPEAKAEPAKEDTLELGGADAPQLTEEQKAEAEAEKNRSRHPSQRIAHYRAVAGDAERRAEAAERRAEEAERRAGIGKAAAPTLTEIMAKEPHFNDKNPDGTDKYEFGEADPLYGEDRQDWKLDVRDAKTRDGAAKDQAASAASETQQKTVAEVTGLLSAKMEAGAKAYNDFQEVVTKGAEAREEPMHAVITVATAASPVGEHIIYRLASDEAAQERLDVEIAKALNQAAQLRASGRQPDPSIFAGAARVFGELEGQYLDNDDDDDLDLSEPLDLMRQLGRERARRKGLTKGAAVERKVTKAPEPAEHRSRGATGQFETRADTADFGAFEKMANRKA